MSAFEADRFNRSRTSPCEKQWSVASGQLPVTVEMLLLQTADSSLRSE
jgi:hypothetical protein